LNSLRPIPLPARLASGLLSLIALGLGLWMLFDTDNSSRSWGDYLLLVALFLIALDFGITGALKGEWPIVSWLGTP
jgi:hypothetical protein